MNVVTANPPLSFHERPIGRLTVEKYEAMVASGNITEDDRLELIEGALLEKMGKRERHATGSAKTGLAIARVLPSGWHVRHDNPVRIPNRDSEPEPDISVARGVPDDYIEHHPGPEDLALVVEVSLWTLQADRALAETYIGGGVPVYWLLNLRDRQLEVYTPANSEPAILAANEFVDLVIASVSAGRITVADLLPKATEE
ncbi:MAG: Uma2 family endonuclease [Isosphaeraceae bacterium]